MATVAKYSIFCLCRWIKTRNSQTERAMQYTNFPEKISHILTALHFKRNEDIRDTEEGEQQTQVF